MTVLPVYGYLSLLRLGMDLITSTEEVMLSLVLVGLFVCLLTRLLKEL